MEELIKATVLAAIYQAAKDGIITTANPAATVQGSPWRDAKGIAEYLGFAPNWVRYNLMHLAHRPAGSDPRWNIHEVDEWVRQNTTAPAERMTVIEAGRKLETATMHISNRRKNY